MNRRIDFDLRRSIAYFSAHPQEVQDRLAELDQEWDIERMLETASATFSLTGLLLSGMGARKRWLLLPLVVQSFFLQHAIQGWCPPLPLLRRLGFRTRREIDAERYALKAIRGDFDHMPEVSGSDAADAAVAAVRKN